MRKKETGTLRVVQKIKRAWEDSNPVKKRGNRHGQVLEVVDMGICAEIFSITFKFQ